MPSKILEGICLVIGAIILATVLFSDDTGSDAEISQTEAAPTSHGLPQSGRRAAYAVFGSGLLAYGIAQILHRNW